MNVHADDDDLVLFFYGEARRPERIERHLSDCHTCRKTYQELTATLGAISAPVVPERGELYGLEVWQRVRQQLPLEGPGRASWWRWSPIRFVAVAAVSVVAAFLAGRHAPTPSPSPTVAPAPDQRLASSNAERARIAAVVEHLERSERLLLDIGNAAVTTLDIANEQRWADELVSANRLYRESARLAGDTAMAAVLDDLERTLLDIVHTPATLTAPALAAVSERVDAAALVFKVRILSHELRDRGSALTDPRKTT